VQVSEIWDSRAQFETFGERLRRMPVLAELGIEFSAHQRSSRCTRSSSASVASFDSAVSARDHLAVLNETLAESLTHEGKEST